MKFDELAERPVHVTSIKVEFRDLDRDTIDRLAMGEYHANLLSMELIRQGDD